MLTKAGADVTVLDALRNAKVSAGAAFPEQMDAPELLEHLATAGKLIHAKQFDDAGKELMAALDSRIGPEAGFVMGKVQDEIREFGNAASIYAKVLEMSPEFPGAHARLSFDMYSLGDADGAMQEAQAALLQYKDDAEAHKNMGLGMDIASKYDGAISEFREALRLRPDYANVHCDLGLVFHDLHRFDEEVAELKKAVSLTPNQAIYHYDLGNALEDINDIDGAIREFRAAKCLDPTRIDARLNLARALSSSDHDASRTEYRELIAMAPGFAMAHDNYGMLMINEGDYKGAEAEYRTSAQLGSFRRDGVYRNRAGFGAPGKVSGSNCRISPSGAARLRLCGRLFRAGTSLFTDQGLFQRYSRAEKRCECRAG